MKTMKKVLPLMLCLVLLAACGETESTGGGVNEMLRLYAAPSEVLEVAVDDLSLGVYWGESELARCAFPETWSDTSPIKLFYVEETIEIRPVSGEHTGEKVNKANVFGQARDAVKYGEWTFAPTQLGVNIEKEGTDQLKVKFADLKYSRDSEDYMLFSRGDDVKAIVSASIGGKAELVSKKDSEYVVKFSGDGVLNQSVNFYMPKQPDTTVYEKASGDNRYYLSPYLYFGDEKRGDSNAFVRFESLDFVDISADEIVSAKYVVQNLTNLKGDVKLSVYGVKSDWCSMNTIWSARPGLDGEPLSTVNIKGAGEYQFDVTDLIKEMLTARGEVRRGAAPEPGMWGVEEDSPAGHTVRNGFALKADEAKDRAVIASGDNGLFSPYLEIVIKR